MATATSGFEKIRGRYHWSNCSYPASFFGINGIAGLPWLALLIHPGYTTLSLAFIVTIALIYIEKVNRMRPAALFRFIHMRMGGKHKILGDYRKDITSFIGSFEEPFDGTGVDRNR